FVAPPKADTTTTGFRSSRPATVSAARAMAAASPTDVPPNLTTIIPVRRLRLRHEDAARHYQLRIQQRSARGTADRVAPHGDKAQIEQRIRPNAAHGDGHPAAGIHVAE